MYYYTLSVEEATKMVIYWCNPHASVTYNSEFCVVMKSTTNEMLKMVGEKGPK